MPRPLPTQAGSSEAIVVPYAAIIKLIPQELWGKLAPAGVAGYTYSIPRRTVLEQLPHGTVKVNFGELRRGAPSGVFINTSAEDGRLVDLPLSEILGQLHPDSLSRRPDQSRVEVSEEVPDLFGAKGERLAPLRVMEKKELSHTTSFARQKGSVPVAAKPATPAAQAVPAVPALNIPLITAKPAAPVPPAPTPVPLSPAPTTTPPSPAPTIKMQPVPPSAVSPAAPPRPPAPFPFSIPKPAASAPPVAGAVPPRPLPKAPLPKLARPVPAATIPIPPAAPPLASPAPAATPAAPTGPGGTQSFLIELDVVGAGWPDGVRQELAQLKIPDAKIALSPVELCEGLKRGRIQYPWRTLRSWIQPTPVYATPSPHDDLVLELPLGTLTPLFLEFIRANPVNRQVADAENITEFFRKAEQASSVSADVLQPLFTGPHQSNVQTPVAAATVAASAPSAPVAPPVVIPSPATAQPAAAPEITVETEALCLPVQVIANSCPEPVLRDIASFGLANSRIAVPLATVEAGLKVGRIEFSWRELCSWLNPPSKPAQVSINGENRIALPLGVVAPLFLKARGAGQGRRKANVAEDIPDLFSAAGKPLPPAPKPAEAPAAAPDRPYSAATAPAPSAAPTPAAASGSTPAAAPPPIAAPTPTTAPAPVNPAGKAAVAPAVVAAATSGPAAAGPKKAAANLSDLFGEPNKKTWTPNEIVQRTTQLSNVAGALIALQDGLLVASNMPPDVRTETIAAFVPQIFGRLNQYSKELQLGDTKAVSFTVSTGTVQVYNAGIIYFAALSKPGALLPLAELQLIAGELGRHTK